MPCSVPIPLRPVMVLWLCFALACAARRPADPTPPPTPEPTADAKPELADEPTATPSSDAPAVLLRGGRVMTATGVIYERGDVLLREGKVEAVGASVDTPTDVTVLDVTGKTVTPGIIDTHSHLGVYASPGLNAHSDGNEAVAPTTPQVISADGYWPQDPQIDRARAGGVTTMLILPGSANLIGGRAVVVRTTPNIRGVEDARFELAPYGIKMACGENPKRVYGDKGGPQTRMGNMAGFRAAFQRAVEYRRTWQAYAAKVKDGSDDEDLSPPTRDFGLETLMGVLDGDILVHTHCYRADDMINIMALAEDYGFKIRSFHHAVEAYKIADRLEAHGSSASVWADWWGFKAEAYDGVRENAAMLSAAGVRAVIHSDSPHGIQRLNQEAAKAMHAGRRAGIDISEDEALRWITANPAWTLGVDQHTGTLEAGKLADVVVWSGNPFSVYAKAERVYLSGTLIFDRNDPKTQPHTDFESGFRTKGAH
ncbi:MAG: amidohydrolase [Myxococcota bacterium]